MKRILLFGLIILTSVCCTKDPLPSKDNVHLEVVVEGVTKTSARVSTKIEAKSFEIISQGICYALANVPTLNDQVVRGTGTLSLLDLNPGSMYLVRAFVVIGEETFYSNHIAFTTEHLIVSLEISEVTKRGATVQFQADASLPGIIESGVCYSTSSNPSTEDETTTGSSTLKIDLLSYETKYFVKAYIKTASKTYYSTEKEFTTIKLPTVKDYDGNEYRVIELASKIGPRKWLLDNFKGTHYANGDPIPHVTDNDEWISLSTGAYCYYDNDKENAKTYGALYNWWAAVDPRGLIVGWHTPSDDEWEEMASIFNNLVQGPDKRGQVLKEAGTKHWQAPNQGANNQSGFTALPAGVKYSNNYGFGYMKTKTYFMSGTEIGDSFWTKILYFDQNQFHDTPGVSKKMGGSIRLIKNN